MKPKMTLSYKSAVKLISLFILFSLFSKDLLSQQNLLQLEKTERPDFYQVKKAYEDIWKDIPQNERKGWKHYKRWEYFWEQRLYPTGEFPDPRMILKEWKSIEVEQNKKESMQSANWQQIGPITLAEAEMKEFGLGRLNIVRFHPTNPNEIWTGAASGGVWKSTDGGSTWKTFPYTNFLSLGVSDIAIATSNPNVIYVATGDADGTLATADQFYSIGLIKSTDGGNTWNTTNMSFFLSQGKVVARIQVHPSNPDIVVVGSSEGIMKSTDGGNTWSNKQSGEYFKDIEINPENHEIMYASTYSLSGNAGIYKSTNFGDTWTLVKRMSGCVRMALGVTPANPLNVYAVCSKTYPGFNFHSFHFSPDAGDTWIERSTLSSAGNILGWHDGTGGDATKGQGQYDLCLAINPNNEDQIFVGGINIWKSDNTGKNWTKMTQWYAGTQQGYIHADHHDLMYQGNSNVIFSTNDGGINKSTDNGKTWINLTNGISITQYYRMGSSASNGRLLIGGAQDNGTSMLKDGNWKHATGGDGMECIIDPTNPDIIYSSMYYGSLYRSTNGGYSFRNFINQDELGEHGDWVTPFVLDPNNPGVLYAAYNNIWKFTNGGNTKEKISNINTSDEFRTLAVANDSKTIYAGTPGALYKTSGDNNWTKILTSNLAITYIAVDENDPNHIWITKSGFTATDKVWEYDGTNWKNITGNLPNVPVNCIVYQKNSQDRIYVGTDIGVFFTDNGSSIWDPYQDGLPNLIINELEINYSSNKLLAATYGRGIWEADLNMCNLPQLQLQMQGSTTFCDGDSLVIEAPLGYNSYKWSNDETSRRIIVKKQGVYSVTASNGDGCLARSQSIPVVVNPLPEIAITSKTNGSLCGDDSVELEATLGFTTYKWSNNQTDRKIKIGQPGTYTVTGTTANGCSITSSVIEVKNVPEPMKPEITREGNVLSAPAAIKYQWYLEDKKIFAATNQTFLANKVGNYKVEITDTNFCTAVSDVYNLDQLGVKDYITGSDVFTIHPNPVSNTCNIEINAVAGSTVMVRISDISGKELISFTGISEDGKFNRNVNMENYPAGVYMLTVFVGDKNYAERIVKQ